MKIEIDNKEITAETIYEEVEGRIGDKTFIVSRWRSYDRNIGISDEGIEFLDDGDNLTEDEQNQVKDYLSEIPMGDEE